MFSPEFSGSRDELVAEGNSRRRGGGRLSASILLSCVWAVLLVNRLPAQDDLATVIELSEKSVVRIEVQGRDGEGLGSGFVVSEAGLVCTNVHVMSGAETAEAIFPDGSKYKITGTVHIDEARDICIVQLDANGLIPIARATDLPRKGETVIALGAPLGLSFTATTGIVSAIRYDFAKDTGAEDAEGTWVQVDAALSPGNSGGPLINNRGEVVAMSTLASSGGRAQNLNFGISILDINDAVNVAVEAPLKSLDETVGKIKDRHVARGGSGSMLKRRPVPESAIRDYVKQCRENYDQMARDIRREAIRVERLAKTMSKGTVGIPMGVEEDTDVYVGKTRSGDHYFFANHAVKEIMVRQNETRAKTLNRIKSTLSSSPFELAVKELALRAGPALVLQQGGGKVGFMDGLKVALPMNDHEILAIYHGTPILMWVDTTVGLAPGTTMLPTLAYVSGTQTIQHPEESISIAVTVVQAITDEEFESAVAYSTWRSKSGKHTVEAKLLGVDGETVRLEKKDGSTIAISLTVLDEISQERVRPK